VRAELVNAGGRDGNAEFVVLDLFGDTDDHFGLHIRWLLRPEVAGEV
jgi:hypothetical protein